MKKPIELLAEDPLKQQNQAIDQSLADDDSTDSIAVANMDSMATCLKLLGDRTRLTMIALLKQRPLCVCDIAEALGTSQPNVSQHLKKLKAAGLLEESRKGQWIYYSVREQDSLYLQAIIRELPSIGASIKPSACE